MSDTYTSDNLARTIEVDRRIGRHVVMKTAQMHTSQFVQTSGEWHSKDELERMSDRISVFAVRKPRFRVRVVAGAQVLIAGPLRRASLHWT